MTRINTVDPCELHTRHLIAEYKELPRMFSYVRDLERKGWNAQIYNRSDTFVLGTGHMRFFTNKLRWLELRFHAIVKEMQRRDIKTTYTQINPNSRPLGEAWWGFWIPTMADVQLSRERIAERIAEKPHLYNRRCHVRRSIRKN